MEMCRACLSSGMNMTTMDESYVHNYNLLTNLDIQYTEVTVYLCDECLKALNFCIEFREKCITSDITLKQILFPDEAIKSEDSNDAKDMTILFENETFIKEEICDDDDDDEEVKYLVIPDDDDNDWEPIRKSSRLKNKTAKFEDVTKLEIKLNKVKHEVKNKEEIIVKKNKTDEIVTHCGLCKETFENKEQVIKHIGIHKMNAVCLLCQTKCVSYPHLLSHRLVHIPRTQRGCLVCNKIFATQYGLEFHYLKTHNLGDENTQYLCKVCLCSYETPTKLGKHVRSVHAPLKYTCEFCKMGFKNRAGLRIHTAKHDDVKKYECYHCDFRCRFYSGIKDHIMRQHTKTRVYCKACGRVFLNQAILNKHTPCKSAVEVLCPICGTNFKNTSSLTRHMRIHTDIKRYGCEKCNKQFKTKGAYQVHMNRHAGIRKYHCQYCPRSFYSGSVLIKHRRIHTGEKPYECSICTKAFTGRHNLKVHMKVHGLDLIVKRTSNEDVT